MLTLTGCVNVRLDDRLDSPGDDINEPPAYFTDAPVINVEPSDNQSPNVDSTEADPSAHPRRIDDA